MADHICIRIDGKEVAVPAGVTVAAALMMAGVSGFRRSVSGQARGPLCGMGSCLECRVTIDGCSHQLSCDRLCREGMDVRTDP